MKKLFEKLSVILLILALCFSTYACNLLPDDSLNDDGNNSNENSSENNGNEGTDAGDVAAQPM